MIITQVVRETHALDDLAKTIDNFPVAFPREVKIAFERDVAPGMLAELRFMPPPFTGKRQWNSERQRRAYFASNGFGAGIPYRRTGKMVAAWNIGVSVSDNAIALYARNNSKSLPFVSGRRQQIMHRNSGWPLPADIFAKWKEPTFRTVDTALDVILGKR
jgi:hypothetical protein